MTKFHVFGIVLGLIVGGFAIQSGCPQFFTVTHVETLYASVASD